MGPSRGLDRRDFLKAAVAIGGSAALSACLDGAGAVDVATGPEDLTTLPTSQHAWNEVLDTDDHGNDVAARHHVLLLVEYDGDGIPGGDESEQLETALRGLERAYARGHEGLLFTVGYTPRYFDRFDDPLPDSVDLPEPEALAPFEDPELDRPDGVIHFASDHAQVVLEAEEALRGNREQVNGGDVEASVDGLFSVAERRTGFVGDGLPAENDDADGVPEDSVSEDAPLFMGFESDFADSQADEERVTIQDGPFAGGTTQHVSTIRLLLDQWYEQDSRYHREATMFCPAHAEEGLIEGTGANLGDSSGIDERGCADTVEDDARQFGKVGHSQKAARTREDGGDPIIIRRDFDATDDDRATLHFVALQRTIADFVETREAMNGTDVAGTGAVGQRTNNGILQYMRVERRGNYLVPPREHRAFPAPRPKA